MLSHEAEGNMVNIFRVISIFKYYCPEPLGEGNKFKNRNDEKNMKPYCPITHAITCLSPETFPFLFANFFLFSKTNPFVQINELFYMIA